MIFFKESFYIFGEVSNKKKKWKTYE